MNTVEDLQRREPLTVAELTALIARERYFQSEARGVELHAPRVAHYLPELIDRLIIARRLEKERDRQEHRPGGSPQHRTQPTAQASANDSSSPVPTGGISE